MVTVISTEKIESSRSLDSR